MHLLMSRFAIPLLAAFNPITMFHLTSRPPEVIVKQNLQTMSAQMQRMWVLGSDDPKSRCIPYSENKDVGVPLGPSITRTRHARSGLEA